jgi:hypothetical protein
MEKSELTEAGNTRHVTSKFEERTQHSLGRPGDCSRRICPLRPNSYFRVVLLKFYGYSTKTWEDFAANFGGKQLAVANSNTTAVIHLTYSPDLDPYNFSPFPFILSQLRWPRHNHRRCGASVENTTSRMHFRKSDAPGTVHTPRKGLLRWWRWPVGRKLGFDKMTAPVPEIKDAYGMCILRTYVCMYVRIYVCKYKHFFIDFLYWLLFLVWYWSNEYEVTRISTVALWLSHKFR